MPIIIVSKVKKLAKAQNKQCSKDFLALLDRRIEERVFKIIESCKFARLTDKDIQ